jgi:hypothetical protein
MILRSGEVSKLSKLTELTATRQIGLPSFHLALSVAVAFHRL